MEAKDTVMKTNKLLDRFGVPLNENILNRDERLKVVAQAQAEISFKVGYEYAIKEYQLQSPVYEDGKKAGRREVDKG